MECELTKQDFSLEFAKNDSLCSMDELPTRYMEMLHVNIANNALDIIDRSLS